jgi:hypothetical protein
MCHRGARHGEKKERDASLGPGLRRVNATLFTHRYIIIIEAGYTSSSSSRTPAKRDAVRPGLYTAHQRSSPCSKSGCIAITDWMFFTSTTAMSSSVPATHVR